ncbi:hypothetical protein ACPCTO_34785 [Streptomyces olivoreticuli]
MPREDEEDFRLETRTEWVFAAKPDREVERIPSPNKLEGEEAAADWVREKKPLLWTGSVFSVPPPSGFPSGAAVTESLLQLLIPHNVQGKPRQELIWEMQPRWPLENILDLFELVGFDLSKSLLSFFNEVNREASPNDLHRAIAKYYHDGLASAPFFFTVNWDTLQERAFRELGFQALVAGPRRRPDDKFDSPGDNSISCFHPHGSFQTRDAVCSFRREVHQLPIASSRWLSHPLAFLGYSGYEPSLYDHLHGNQPQLWCVRRLEDDMKIPAKRRILCRPNVSVYEGDLRKLLTCLGLLSADINLDSNYLALESKVPGKVIDLLSIALASSINPNACLLALSSELSSAHPEPEATIRYCVIMKCLTDHIRDRVNNPEFLPALMAASAKRNTEQLWISALAYILRHQEPPAASILTLLDRAQNAAAASPKLPDPIDEAILTPGTAYGRTKVYRDFVEESARSLHPGEYIMPPFFGGDLAGVGEFAELLAFEYLRQGDPGKAKSIFDYAASRLYLSGNWNAGRLNELAYLNIDQLAGRWDRKSLRIPL